MSHFLTIPINEHGIILEQRFKAELRSAATDPFGFTEVFLHSHGWWSTAPAPRPNTTFFPWVWPRRCRGWCARVPRNGPRSAPHSRLWRCPSTGRPGCAKTGLGHWPPGGVCVFHTAAARRQCRPARRSVPAGTVLRPMMLRAYAVTADENGRFQEAAASYEASLLSDPADLETTVNLAVLYWQAGGRDRSAHSSLPPEFLKYAQERLHELLDSAGGRFADRAQLRFWKKYIAAAGSRRAARARRMPAAHAGTSRLPRARIRRIFRQRRRGSRAGGNAAAGRLFRAADGPRPLRDIHHQRCAAQAALARVPRTNCLAYSTTLTATLVDPAAVARHRPAADLNPA